MNRNIRRALDIALNAEHPRRFHHEIARTGYAAGGPSSISDIAHDIPYMEKGETLSPISVAKMQPYTASGIAPAPSQAIAPKKVSLKPGKMAKLRMKKPRMLKPKKLRLEQGGSAVDDALDFASRAMKDMAKRGPDMHGMATSQGSTSTVVREKVPGKRAETIYEHHEQTPPEHRIFGADEEPYGMHEDIKNALRLARASGGRNKEIVEPYSYNEYGEFRGRDVGKWRTEHGKKGRAKDYNPWSDPNNMYTHPSEDRHDPEDPMYYISPEEYREGTQGKGIYAMANGGRAHLALGGNPAIGTTPADPTLPLGAAATPTVPVGNAALPLVNAVANPPLLGANPAVSPTALPGANPAVPPVPATPQLGSAVPPGVTAGAPTATTALTNPLAPAAIPAAQPAMIPSMDPNANYISSLYQNLLGRAPEEEGFQYWQDQLDQGNLSQGDIFREFAGSNEFQNLYQTDPTKAIGLLYQEALGRTPEQSGLQYWQQQAQQGTTLPSMVQNFLQSQEGQTVSNISRVYQDYTGNVPTNNQLSTAGQILAVGGNMNDVRNYVANSPDANKYYVNQTYQELMGRDPDPEGLKYWTDQLSSGQINPDDFYNTVANSQESANYANTSFINDEYQGLLGRDPTQEELNTALDQLASGKITQAQFDQDLSNSDASMQYQASNFAPYQVADAGAGAVSNNQPRTQFQLYTFLEQLPQQVVAAGKSALIRAMDALGITDPAMRNAMAANVQVETGFGKGTEIGYGGTSNKRIRSLFSNTKKLSDAELNNLKRDPRAFFNYIYGNKNGNQGGDDGFNYRGRGAVQLTGRGNYLKYGQLAGLGDALVNDPDLMLDPDISAKVSVAYMKDMAEHHSGRNVFDKITRGVNAHAPTVAKKRVAYSKLGKSSPFANITGSVETAAGGAPTNGAPMDPALNQQLGQQLAQSGAGGNIAGSGMFNPGGGMIGITNTGMTIDPNAGGGFAANPPLTNYDPLFNAGMNANAGAAAAGATYFNPFTSQQGSMSFDPNTGIGIQSPLYLGPGQYGPIGGYNPYAVTGYNPPGVSFGNPFGWKDGGSVGTRSRMRRGLELSSGHEDAVDDALRIAKSRSQYAHGGEVWDKPRPKGIGKSHKLTSGQKSSAKAAAERAGRPYPNLIDNMRAARKSH